MTSFDPKIAELAQRGATAGLLLEYQQHIIGECVEHCLAKIDDAVTNQRMTPELAIGLVHEVAAFRRILGRQRNEVRRGKLEMS